MSVLIKSGSASPVRPFASPPVARQPVAAAPDPRDAELAALRGEVDRLAATIDAMQERADKVALEAWEQGRRAGIDEAATRDEERIEALRDGIGEAVAAFDAHFGEVERLGPALARAALAKLFAKPDRWAEMVAAAIAAQLAALRQGSVLRVSVSPLDFGDLADFPFAASDGIALAHDAGLRAGAARIECRLGEVDLDVREQWAELSSLFGRMIESA